MQRFKKELIARYGGHWHNTGKGPRINLCASPNHGKFVYGANGSLTQAARWRIGAILNTATRRDIVLDNQGLHQNCMLTISIMSLLDSSRRGGCRLP